MDEDTMRPTDFHIGMRFYNPVGQWQCTDIGTRTIAAIRLDAPDESWYVGPVYAVVEHVMDEEDLEVCVRTYEEAYDAWGEDFARDCQSKSRPHRSPLDLSQDVFAVPRVETSQLPPEICAYLETQKSRSAHIPLIDGGIPTGWNFVYTAE